MFREILNFLHSDGWPVAPDTFDGLPCIRTRFSGSTDAWDCRARPYDPFAQLAFESIVPVAVDAEHRTAVSDLVLRVNWRLLTGAFQLDPEGNELAFRTVLLTNGGELTDDLCRGLIYSNVLTVDRCLEEFKGAAAGDDALAAFTRLAL
jgi:hypothetical protein